MNSARLEIFLSEHGGARDHPGANDMGLANTHTNSNQCFLGQPSQSPLLALKGSSSSTKYKDEWYKAWEIFIKGWRC